jgi:hypothetical protein
VLHVSARHWNLREPHPRLPATSTARRRTRSPRGTPRRRASR